jgi:hypothetical protein
MTACQQCGTVMPIPTGQAGRKRFCSVECRKAAWRQRHRDSTIPAVPPTAHRVPAVPLAVPLAVPAVPSVVAAFPDAPSVVAAFPDDVPTPGGQHRCPHCRQPLAVISVLVPAAAAHIQPPEVTHA